MGSLIRDSIARAMAAAAAAANGAGKDVGRGRDVGRERKTGGMVLSDGQGWGREVLLLVGPYLRMLTTEAVTETWVKALCQRAELLCERQDKSTTGTCRMCTAAYVCRCRSSAGQQQRLGRWGLRQGQGQHRPHVQQPAVWLCCCSSAGIAAPAGWSRRCGRCVRRATQRPCGRARPPASRR